MALQYWQRSKSSKAVQWYLHLWSHAVVGEYLVPIALNYAHCAAAAVGQSIVRIQFVVARFVVVVVADAVTLQHLSLGWLCHS